ncbi:unnamed protein product [Rotaria sordida]|uniref:UEV domain-containing protein n=1 Tax=Rotaria sordida TaxID=392033 RepID=A0A819IA87_9BILA|nr:unnamed protein product [Rotaria sordida]
MKQSQNEIDQMIKLAQSKNRDLVPDDINQAINSPISNLILKVAEYYYDDGTSKELLCLAGTVVCHYKGNRYNIPIEIWLQQDHPNVPPLAYVRPTPDMYISTTSKDVQPDGAIIIPYLLNWHHPNSNLADLLKTTSNAFSQSPPVYSTSSMTNRTTLYSATASSKPTPIGMGNDINPSYSYPYGYL